MFVTTVYIYAKNISFTVNSLVVPFTHLRRSHENAKSRVGLLECHNVKSATRLARRLRDYNCKIVGINISI